MYGFAVTSLPKLLECRSLDGSTTLQHFLVAGILATEPELLKLREQLPTLATAIKAQLDDVTDKVRSNFE